MTAGAKNSSRAAAVWMVLLGGLFAVGTGFLSLFLVREQLHIACAFGQPGTVAAGTWMCADGIGYLGVAVALGGIAIVVVLIGSLVAGLIGQERIARFLLVGLAFVAAAGVYGATWYGSSELVLSTPRGVQSTDYWSAVVLPSATTSGAALLLAVIGLASAGKPARVLTASSAVGVVVATVLQPGVGITTIAAAGLVAAAAFRAVERASAEAGARKVP